jgi:hypothetical protein
MKFPLGFKNLQLNGLLSRFLVASLSLATILAATGTAHAGLIGTTPANCNCAINMQENGGPVMTGHVDTFAIYYGDFATANSTYPVAAQQVVSNWLGNMAGTDYMNIAATYTGAPNGPVSTDVSYNGEYDVATDYLGTSLSDANILQIVQDAESSNALPTVSNAIYFVFTAPEIGQQEAGGACGWHDGDASSNTVYSWVGPALGCDYVGGVSGNGIADEFTETGSHELFEALTDPFPNSAYNDQNYGEVGDVCTNSNFVGNLHGVNVDLQSIWGLDASNPNGGACAQGFNASAKDVPEPATGALFLIGCTALLGSRLRRRR